MVLLPFPLLQVSFLCVCEVTEHTVPPKSLDSPTLRLLLLSLRVGSSR